MPGRARVPLAAALDALEALHGRPKKPLPRTPFAWVLWENVAYLVDDARRAEVYRALEKRTALDPGRIARLSDEALEALIARGGMRPADRVRKVRACVDIARELGGGDLTQVLKLPLPKARAALKRFPGIGAPGADKILLLCGAGEQLALDSNGLRVLQRLGHGTTQGAYAAQYRAVLADVAGELPARPAALARAHLLLRAHGQTVCRSTTPECGACPLADRCPSA